MAVSYACANVWSCSVCAEYQRQRMKTMMIDTYMEERSVDAVTVLIIDDQPLFRQGVVQAIAASSASIEVVGEAGNGHDGLRLAEDLTPAVVLLNAEVEGLNGLEAIRQMKRLDPNIRVVVMTTFEDEEK